MKRWIVVLVMLVASHGIQAQGFVTKTNELNLSLKKGIPNSTSLPVVEWLVPMQEYMSSQEKRVELSARVTSTLSLKSVTLIVGDNVSGAERMSKKIDLVDERTAEVKQVVNFLDGSHYVRVRAENIDGAVVTSTRSIVVGMDAVALAIDRKDYALMFATDKYDHWDDLVNPVEDAHAIARELREKYGFDVELVENATQDQVFEKIREYNERKYKPQDQLLVFFAGHGTFDESFGEGFVVAKNSLANDKAKNTYISHNRLRGIINNIPCEHILLTMDVCFGGTLDPEIAKTRSAEDETSVDEMVVRKLSVKTRRYLTSGGKEYVSDGIPGKHSPFAGKLIESLRSYGGADRVLTLHELVSSMDVLKQVPRTGSFGDDQKQSDFVFIGKQ